MPGPFATRISPLAQPPRFAVPQAMPVQPVPQAMQQAQPAPPGAFQAALMHEPVQARRLELETSQVGVPVQQDTAEPADPVIIHAPRKDDSKLRAPASPAGETTSQAGQRPVHAPPTATTSSSRTSTSSWGCGGDSSLDVIIVNNDGGCGDAINACATAVLRSCQALARLPGAARDCLPSSQALHNGCNTLTSAGAQSCEAFGRCVIGGLDLCKDIITCPCTVCGEICKACCDGSSQSNADGCSGCDCNCSGCDCNGCDCGGCTC